MHAVLAEPSGGAQHAQHTLTETNQGRSCSEPAVTRVRRCHASSLCSKQGKPRSPGCKSSQETERQEASQQGVESLQQPCKLPSALRSLPHEHPHSRAERCLTRMPAFFTARGSPSSPVPIFPFRRWIRVWYHLRERRRRDGHCQIPTCRPCTVSALSSSCSGSSSSELLQEHTQRFRSCPLSPVGLSKDWRQRLKQISGGHLQNQLQGKTQHELSTNL